MSALAAMVAYATLLGVVAPMVLRRGTWMTRAPRLAIAVWLALSVSWLVSIAVAGLAMATPWLRSAPTQGLPPSQDWPDAMSHVAVFRIMGFLGTALTVAVVTTASHAILREVVPTRRIRRGHAAALASVARPAPDLGAVVVDHATPAAYSMPGCRSQIVITTGALELLDNDQLHAVLAHEHAHLHGRHHMVTALAAGLGRAFSAVPLLDHGRREIATLLEMAADDAASRRHGGTTLAAALLNLAKANIPAATLGAGGRAVVQRVTRMLNPPPPLGRTAQAAYAVTAATTFALPVAGPCLPLVVLLMSLV